MVAPELSSQNAHKTKKSRTNVFLTALVFIGLAVCSAYFFHAYRNAVAANPANQQKSIIQQVNDLVMTPNEQPQIATVKDASKLTNSALTRKTKNGDVLLIYDKASQIIVYRPATKKIVDMLTVQASTSTDTSGATTSSPAKT